MDKPLLRRFWVLLSVCIFCAPLACAGGLDIRPDAEGFFAGAQIGAQDELICENDGFRMFLDADNLLIKVEDRRNGYVWQSGRADESTQGLSKKWKNLARAFVSAEVVQVKTLTESVVLPDFEAVQVQRLAQGLDVLIPLSGVEIDVEMQIRLTDDGLRVTLPDEGIHHRDTEYRLAELTVFPFLGAAERNEGSGYLFIPDGSGALVRFDTDVSATTVYDQPIYGEDRSLVWTMSQSTAKSRNAKSMQHVFLPVMGIVHGENQNAVLIHVTGGAESASVYAAAADQITDFFYTAPKFCYGAIYIQPDGAGGGFSMMTEEGRPIGAEVEYIFLEGEAANWVGMAQVCRDRLSLPRMDRDVGTIPLLIDALMSETVQGAVSEKTVTLSTLQDVSRWHRFFAEQDVGCVLYSLRGTAKGGISRQKVDDFALDKGVGTQAELAGLVAQVEATGGRVLLHRDLASAYEGQIAGRKLRYGVHRKYVYQAADGELDGERYYLSDTAMTEVGRKLVEAAKKWSGISIAGLTRDPQGDYRNGRESTRLDALTHARTLMAELKQNTAYLLSECPDAYAAGMSDACYDVPYQHSAMVFETDTVPFLQMVYSGSMDLFAEASIPGNSDQIQLLRMIAFNVYPQYTLMGADEAQLEKSNQNMVFSANFDRLAQAAAEEYHMVNAILSSVRGAAMADFAVPQENVAVVRYDNGVRIVVNFNADAVAVDGVPVPGASAAVLGAEEREMP